MEISNGHHQAMASYSLNEVLPVLGCPKASASSPHQLLQEMNRRPQSQPQQALRCPRCDSSNTKFCYYNNYSLSQPRYFCKSCRRYWTKGGSLRNVPVGGGCRKNKRSSSSSSSPSSSSKKLTLPQEQQDNYNTLPLPPLSFEPIDLSLAFSSFQSDAFLLGNHNSNPNLNPNSAPNPTSHGFLDILRSGLVGSTNQTPALGGLQSLYYGFGGGSTEEVEGGDNGGVMLPFDHGELNVSNSTTAGVLVADNSTATNASASTSHGSYWNGAGSISWHGFINGFPHEIHDGA